MDDALLLSLRETAGLLGRVMRGRDALAWLEADRRHDPVLPWLMRDGEVFYRAEAVLRLVRLLDATAALRTGRVRRSGLDRRRGHDRRQQGERRARWREASRWVDRRLGLRPDRRSDLDRRIRGWLDRRVIPDRRLRPAAR